MISVMAIAAIVYTLFIFHTLKKMQRQQQQYYNMRELDEMPDRICSFLVSVTAIVYIVYTVISNS